MKPGIPAATTAAPAMTRPAQTGDPPQPPSEQPRRADSDGRSPRPQKSDGRSPGPQKSDDHNAGPSGDLTISAVDLAALLQNRPSRGWLYDHAASVIAALIGAWTVAMLAFMQQGFNDLKAEISRVETDLKAEISRVETDLKAEISWVETDLKAEIAGIRGDIQELRSDINSIDKRLSVLIGILNLEHEVDRAVQGGFTGRIGTLGDYENPVIRKLIGSALPS